MQTLDLEALDQGFWEIGEDAKELISELQADTDRSVDEIDLLKEKIVEFIDLINTSRTRFASSLGVNETIEGTMLSTMTLNLGYQQIDTEASLQLVRKAQRQAAYALASVLLLKIKQGSF